MNAPIQPGATAPSVNPDRQPITIDGTFTKVPDDSWRSRLISARNQLIKRTVPAFIEFCREVHAFRLDCDATQGGSLFSKLGCEWLGVTHGQLSRWDAVGRRADELVSVDTSLPASERAISDIAMLDDIAFPKALEHIKPDMTQKDVRELVKDLNPRPEPTPEDRARSIARKQDRLVRDLLDLPPPQRTAVLEDVGIEPITADPVRIIEQHREQMTPEEQAHLWREWGRALPEKGIDRLEVAKEAVANLDARELAALRKWMKEAGV